MNDQNEFKKNVLETSFNRPMEQGWIVFDCGTIFQQSVDDIWPCL